MYNEKTVLTTGDADLLGTVLTTRLLKTNIETIRIFSSDMNALFG